MVTEKQMQDESHIRRVLSKTDANTIASLTAEVAEWRQAAQVEAGLRREFLARAEAAEAQVEKLRAALEEIARTAPAVDSVTGKIFEYERNVARAALQSTEGDGR